jgi:hypothetical protein
VSLAGRWGLALSPGLALLSTSPASGPSLSHDYSTFHPPSNFRPEEAKWSPQSVAGFGGVAGVIGAGEVQSLSQSFGTHIRCLLGTSGRGSGLKLPVGSGLVSRSKTFPSSHPRPSSGACSPTQPGSAREVSTTTGRAFVRGVRFAPAVPDERGPGGAAWTITQAAFGRLWV